MAAAGIKMLVMSVEFFVVKPPLSADHDMAGDRREVSKGRLLRTDRSSYGSTPTRLAYSTVSPRFGSRAVSAFRR